MHLDIREILSKRIGRRLPKFISRPLEKLIHQDELNGFFATCEGATPEEFLKKAFEFLNVTHTVEYTAPKRHCPFLWKELQIKLPLVRSRQRK